MAEIFRWSENDICRRTDAKEDKLDSFDRSQKFQLSYRALHDRWLKLPHRVEDQKWVLSSRNNTNSPPIDKLRMLLLQFISRFRCSFVIQVIEDESDTRWRTDVIRRWRKQTGIQFADVARKISSSSLVDWMLASHLSKVILNLLVVHRSELLSHHTVPKKCRYVMVTEPDRVFSWPNQTPDVSQYCYWTHTYHLPVTNVQYQPYHLWCVIRNLIF